MGRMLINQQLNRTTMRTKETQHEEILRALRNGEEVSTWWGFLRGN